jgi:hypothetical protein
MMTTFQQGMLTLDRIRNGGGRLCTSSITARCK